MSIDTFALMVDVVVIRMIDNAWPSLDFAVKKFLNAKF